MLTHRTNILLFAFLVLILAILIRYFNFHSYIIIFPLLTFIFLEIMGASMLSANFHFKSICNAETNEKIISLTFDDGSHGEATEKVLAVLKEFNVSATFFCIGKKINNEVPLLKKMSDAGHIIGNHSYSHGNLFDLQPTSKLVEELELTNKIIKEIIGKTPLFFRPPYGVATPALGRAIQKANMISVGWDIRSFDTSIKDSEKIFQKVKSQIKPGCIILLHDRIEGCDIVVRLLLNHLKENNFNVVSLDKLINKPAYV
jgi:peptidoglycan/xylan/chitin deacetylase (PgdA/CDA1 family)